MVVAGATRRAFDVTEATVKEYGILERERNIIADLPRQYGKPEEFKYTKGGSLDIQPVSKEALIRAIQKCHQTLWGGGRLSPPTAFGELSKIIFVKISDEQNTRKGDPYQFQIKTHESSVRLGQRIRDLYGTQRAKDPEVFAETIRIDDATLRTVVSHLESINLNKTDLDTKGVAFEQFMDGFFKGDFRQYFTPREVIALVVEMTRPTHEDLALDPTCGSGGFLLYALDAVRREAGSYYDEGTTYYFKHWHDFAKGRLFGIEINDEIARVAKMNMIIHDDGHTNVVGTDALQPMEQLTSLNSGFASDRFDLILTNPPFGAMVKQTEKPYLTDYDLAWLTNKPTTGVEAEITTTADPKAGMRANKQKTSVKTEILFLEQVWQFLKPGTGRMAIVLPDGILTNSSLQPVRDGLLERFQLLAVVSLPQFAFAHYGAGVKASVVFLRKRANRVNDETPSDDEPIFMAVAENIGYDATGRKTFKTVKQSVVGKAMQELQRCDLFDVLVTFENVGTDATPQWAERHRTAIPESGIVGQYWKFRENPDPFFRVSPAVGDWTCFAVRRGWLKLRLDAPYSFPKYHAQERQLLESRFGACQLGDSRVVKTIVEGRITREATCYSDEPDDPVFLRAQNIQKGHLGFEDAKRLLPQAFEAEPKAILRDGDIVLTIDGVLLGVAAVHRATDVPCCISNHMVRIVHGSGIDSEYLAWFLNSPVGQRQIKREITGSAIPGLQTDAIERILVPLPPLDVQRVLVAELEAARSAQQAKLAQADALLAGMDGYVLEQLGLELPAEDQRSAYAVTQGQLNNRVDAPFYAPHLRKVENVVRACKPRVAPLSSLLRSPPINGVDARDFQETGFRYLRVQNVRPFELALDDVKYVSDVDIQKDVSLSVGDVVLTRKGTFGVAAPVPKGVEDCMISSEIILLRLSAKAACSAAYLAAWLNSKPARILLDRYSAGGIMGHLTQEVVSAFPVPIPDAAAQDKIVGEIARRRETARCLRAEAAAE